MKKSLTVMLPEELIKEIDTIRLETERGKAKTIEILLREGISSYHSSDKKD